LVKDKYYRFKPKPLEEVEHIRIANRSHIILKPDEDFEL
jgi:hypothetical protein